MNIDHGNCYQFDIPDEALNRDETEQVIDALLYDLEKLPVGKIFVLDIAIGPDSAQGLEWTDFVSTRKKFKRAEFEKSSAQISKAEVIQFLRDNFADMLSLPAPGLRRIK